MLDPTTTLQGQHYLKKKNKKKKIAIAGLKGSQVGKTLLVSLWVEGIP